MMDWYGRKKRKSDRVRAVVWDGKDFDRWIVTGYFFKSDQGTLNFIRVAGGTREKAITVGIGDYILHDVDHWRVMKKGDFERVYEAVPE